MKKLLYSILALAGVTFASCTQEHIDVQYIPENAVAPVLGDIQGCALEDGGADIVVEYTKADFGVATAQAHNLYVSKSEDMADMKKAKATFDAATITLKQSDLNIVALEFADAGAEVEMYFAIVANLNTDKGAAVAGTELKSNVVKATFKSFVADILPTEKFDKVWVIGDYCGWDHGKTQFLFDYTSSGNIYSGVVDFADKAANGFKLTGVAGWDDTCNWGLEDNTTAEAEATSLQLITGGGSQDIKCYSKRFYGFEYDKSAMVLKKAWGANQIGVIGLNGDWDNDIVMEYNPVWTRFYVDIEATADTEMKFRADAGWDLNWGAGCANGGDNIAVPAGKYRVYFNPASGLIELSASKYGTEEDLGGNGGNGGGNEEPEGPVTEPDRWGVVGTLTSWGDAADLYMSEVGENLFVRANVTLTAEDQFKVRYNNGWDINAGAAGEVEPFAVTIGEELVLVGGGKNLSAPAGTYDIYFNAQTYQMWVMNPGETPDGVEVKTVKIYVDVTATNWTECSIWAWDNDANYTGGNWPGELLSKDGDNYVWNVPADAVGKTINVIFNNNNNGEQTADINGVVMDQDHYFVVNADFSYTMDGETPAEPEKPAEKVYGLVGTINSWGETADLALAAHKGSWVTYKNFTVSSEDQFKVRVNSNWGENYGAAGDVEPFALTTAEKYTLVGDGKNMSIVGGTYDVYFNTATAEFIIVAAGAEDPTVGAAVNYGLVGTINSWGDTPDIAFEAIGDGGYKLLGQALTTDDAVKIRANNEWNDAENYGLPTAGVLTTNAANTLICGGGSGNMKVAANGTYDFYFYPAELTLYVMEAGQTPQR